jgi:16S rRNA (cytidine1402-2'-O)-methyltransferase
MLEEGKKQVNATVDSDEHWFEQSTELESGTLYVVGTPIGNLGDISFRAIGTLQSVDWIAAEDTRRTRQLLHHLKIKKRLVSYHKHNTRSRIDWLISQLKEGKRLALVSDAGMPGISDPGSELVSACAEVKIPVVVIPGPNAAIVALVVSGLDTSRFAFEGFIPARGKMRKERIEAVAREKRTTVLYEAPHRISRTVQDLYAAGLGERYFVMARELTKRFETITRLTVEKASQLDKESFRGEYVLILEGWDAFSQRCPESREKGAGVREPNQTKTDAQDPDEIRIDALIRAGLTAKDIMKQCGPVSKRSRNELYSLILNQMNIHNHNKEPGQ